MRAAAAFEVPGYRRLLLNSLCTSAALTVEIMSHGWLVLQLTNSPFWVGLAVAVRGASQTVASIPAGAAADRLDRRGLLTGIQAAAALGAGAMAYLVLTHRVALWHVLVYLVLVGSATAANRPAAHGLLYDVVGERRLLNASAFHFMGNSIVRIGGALAGGIIIDRLGTGQNYLVITALYAAGIGAITGLRGPASRRTAPEPFGRAVAAGFRYAFRTPRIRELLLLSLTIEAFGFSTFSMLPVMARDVLRVGGTGLGNLVAASGMGQLLATVFVASRMESRHLGAAVAASSVGFGLFVVLFALSPWLGLSLVLIAIVGFMATAYDTTIATSFQMAVSDEMRGRVLGLYTATFGVNSVGALWIGAIATILAMPAALAISGVVVVVSSVGLIRRRGTLGGPASGAWLLTARATVSAAAPESPAPDA